jgi:hypothetical protein
MNIEYRGKKMATCTICECDVPNEKIKHISIKGKVKKICEDCVTAVKGII